MGIIKSLVILLAGAALATFLWSNYDQTVVVYFTRHFRTIELPLAAALVVSLVTGLLLAVTLSLPNQFRLRGRIRELSRKIERLESENAELRKLPLDDAIPKSPAKPREKDRSDRSDRSTAAGAAGGAAGKSPSSSSSSSSGV
jgi:uncharacterized integral membrane protein